MPSVKYSGNFPPDNIKWTDLISLLGPASAALARYDGLLRAILNPGVLLSPLMTQEAVLSSRIEGTQASLTEVLEYEAGEREVGAGKEEDILEILNYRKAVLFAEKQLDTAVGSPLSAALRKGSETLPLSGRLIREAHARLLAGVRGKEKDPGNFRRTENWIGKPGCSKEDATFVPIEPQKLLDGISRWEKYLHSEQPDLLVQLAVIHAEFEALHPFYDGNGRIGRMLLPLFLYERKLLSSPNFYMSAFFESHRDEYYERLLAVSRDGDWTGWCGYFLKAVIEQADQNSVKAGNIIALYNKMKGWIIDKTHSQYAIKALDFLFNRTIFSGSEFLRHSEIPGTTAKRILSTLIKENVLWTLRSRAGRRPAIFLFPELMNITEGRQVFKKPDSIP